METLAELREDIETLRSELGVPAEGAPGVQLQIKTLTGHQVEIFVGAGSTIWDLKLEIQRAAGFGCAQQRLIFGGAQLDDGKTLGECAIQDRSVVYVVLRPEDSVRGFHPEPESEHIPGFSVSVMTASGMQIRVPTSTGSTVGQVKDIVAQAGGDVTPAHCMFSANGGPELPNGQTLGDLGVANGTLLLISAPQLSLELGIDAGAAQTPAVAERLPSRPLKRSVSFSAASLERITEESSASVEQGTTKGNDGPSVDSALLDRLVVAFFEKGSIRSADGVRSFVGSDELNLSGPAVAARLEQIVDTLRSGRRVGLLPSNARLGPEHSVRLARLLEYLQTSLS